MKAGYGNFGENKGNRTKSKFTKSEEEFKKFVGKVNFKDTMILNDNINLVCENKLTVFENKPVHIAQSILDNSKNIMQLYYYNHIKKVFGNRAKLIYTDSAYLIVVSEDFYAEIKPYAHEWYNTSVYEPKKPGDPEHPAVNECGFSVGLNKKRPGFMADDCPHDFITEMFATSSKQYYYETESGKKEIKSKGISDRKNVLTRDDFYNAVFESKKKQIEQKQIRSFGLIKYTISMKKNVFSEDKKRIVLDNKINTLHNGHWRIIDDNLILPETLPLPRKGTLGRLCLEMLRDQYRKKSEVSLSKQMT